MSDDWNNVTRSKMDFDEIRIKIYQDAGVAASRWVSAGEYQGKPFELHEWPSNVFIRKEGAWVCVHTIVTPARKPEN